MIAFLIPFMALAALGFVCSALVHLCALAGVVPPGGNAVFALHGGIFVIWVPVMILVMRISRGRRGMMSWMDQLSGCPVWMRWLILALFAYAVLNFFLAFGGQISGHEDNEANAPSTLRGFSGHWMAFYAAGFGVMLTGYRKPWMLRAAKCPAGHKITHDQRFCATCGTALPDPAAKPAR